MTTDKPANENLSFALITDNLRQDRAEDVLAAALDMLKEENVPKSVLAEVMFDSLMTEMLPDVPVTKEEGVTWLCQLHRFRNAIDEQLKEINDVYDAPREDTSS